MGRWLITTVERGDTTALADVRDLLETYHSELVAEIGRTSLTEELVTLPAPYERPDGALLLARDETGRGVGCVGIRRRSATACEIKRLYVSADVRGNGLGRALVRAAVDQARAMGYEEMLLIAVARTTANAQRIYRDCGFEPAPPFRELPPEQDPAGFLYMRRRL